MNDEQLMQQVVAGDQAAFAELYNRHAPILLGVLFKMVGQRQVAEELLQETYWRIWDKADSFDASRASFRTWMFSIGRRIAIDWMRRRSARPQQTDGGEATERTLNQLPASADVVEDVQQVEARDELQIALAELPEEQRDVIQLAYFKGLSRREIAATTGLPLGTVNTRVRLALQRMRGVLVVQGWES